MARRTDDRTERTNVSTDPRAPRVHPETGWQATPAGHRFDPGPRGADGGGAGLGADLRDRPSTGATRLPAKPQRPGRREASPWVCEHGAYGGGGRRPLRLLRQYPACRAHEIAGTTHQRPAPLGAALPFLGA